jgi:hypothetical protein
VSAARAFDWIAPDLAVGGRLPALGADALIRRERVGAVVDLRLEACDDRAALRRLGVALLHLPTPDRLGVGQPMLDAGVDFARRMAGQGRRLLVHCHEGVGRSATLALCVLVDRGLPPLDALRLAKAARPAISPSEAQYQAWARWLARHGEAAPTYHAFGCVAYAPARPAGRDPASGPAA